MGQLSQQGKNTCLCHIRAPCCALRLPAPSVLAMIGPGIWFISISSRTGLCLIHWCHCMGYGQAWAGGTSPQPTKSLYLNPLRPQPALLPRAPCSYSAGCAQLLQELLPPASAFCPGPGLLEGINVNNNRSCCRREFQSMRTPLCCIIPPHGRFQDTGENERKACYKAWPMAGT